MRFRTTLLLACVMCVATGVAAQPAPPAEEPRASNVTASSENARPETPTAPSIVAPSRPTLGPSSDGLLLSPGGPPALQVAPPPPPIPVPGPASAQGAGGGGNDSRAPGACGAQEGRPAAASLDAGATAATRPDQFPGVSAAQFPRAGVSASQFERPGVSAERLAALNPGISPVPSRTCVPAELPVLEPPQAPRRILPTQGDGF